MYGSGVDRSIGRPSGGQCPPSGADVRRMVDAWTSRGDGVDAGQPSGRSM